MSSGGDDEPPSPSAYLEAPSSQSLIIDTQPFTSQSVQHGAKRHSDAEDESSSDERENRFVGPASTWRFWTKDERALISSLDQERANDLSVHLYNAHAMKSQLRDADVASKAKPWQSKLHWMKTGVDGSTPWHPDQHWTAWPLPADEVPRKSEAFGRNAFLDDEDGDTLTMHAPWRPGADLQDEIQALILRRAKYRFRSRSRGNEEPDRASAVRSRSISMMGSSPPVTTKSRQSSEASSAGSESSETEHETPNVEEFSKPDFMTDDEEASRLLKQSVCHVGTKFDDILVGLHKSRQHHTSSSAAQSDADTRSRPHKRKRQATIDEKPDLEEHAQHHASHHTLGTRDWSEVLGMASLMGWNPAVIDRAATRCAALFGESMLFRTMPETAAGSATDRLAEYTPAMVPDFDMSDDADVAEERDGQGDVVQQEGLNCPEVSCQQHTRFYEKLWMIRQHLKHTHKYDQEALDAYSRSHASGDVKSSIEKTHEEERVQPETKHTPTVAVETDGFMESVDVSLGRGEDAQDRKSRGPKRK